MTRNPNVLPRFVNLIMILPLSAITLGGVLAFIHSGTHFQFLSPLVLAAGGMLIVALVIWRSHIHSLPAIVFLCTAFAIIVYGTHIVASYYAQRLDTDGIWYDGVTPYDDFDAYLEAAVGQGGIIGFVEASINTGIQVTDAGYVPGTTEVTGSGVLFYWAIDFVIILGMSLYGGWLAYKRPFSPTCQRYFGFIPLSTTTFNVEEIAQIDHDSVTPFVEQLQLNRLEQAGSMLATSIGDVRVYLERAYDCEHPDKSMNLLVATLKQQANYGNRVIYRQPINATGLRRFMTFIGPITVQPSNRDEIRWFLTGIVIWAVATGMMTAFSRALDLFP